MNIPVEIVCIFAGAVIGLQAWSLAELVKLKVKVAAMIEHCKQCQILRDIESATNVHIKHTAI
jgi:hypothetical protein